MYENLQKRKEVNEQFGNEMNKDVNGNRKLFRKEASKENGGKVESCSKIKDGIMGEVNVRKI